MKSNKAIRGCVFAMAAALMAGGTACSSNSKKQTHVDESANQSEHNRMLVRMALAENVYNGTAVERAIYPGDFDHGKALLSELGAKRVETLAHAYSGGSGSIVVIQGDESQELYDARVAAIRQHFADAGLDPQYVYVAKGGHAGGAGVSSDLAVLPYNKMISEYAPKAAAPSGDAVLTLQRPSASRSK